jgi:glycosyltransferase involved in cell wall biosynthesis
MRPTRKLLSIAHSYVVALNRRLAHELARVDGHTWDVTAVAPTYFGAGRDLRAVSLEPLSPEPCKLVPLRAYWTRLVHLFCYGPRLRSLLAQDWDLVHCWEEPYVLAGGQIAWWTARRTPLVFWTAQNLAKQYLPPFGWIERYSLYRCAGWMACGQSVIDTMLQRGYGGKPYRVMPLGVDLNTFRPDPSAGQAVRRQLGWDKDGAPVIGYLGRFVSEKGLHLLMRVLDGLTTPWRALLVGAGPLELTVRAWARKHGDRVRVCTDVKHNAVARYLNAMDVLCAPSQTASHWREQFGRMLIEAFACGVPVVGSDSGEIPHVIGDAGLVVGEKHEEDWCSVLSDLLEDAPRRRELADRGLGRVRERYAWPVIARQYLNFFEEVAADSRR